MWVLVECTEDCRVAELNASSSATTCSFILRCRVDESELGRWPAPHRAYSCCSAKESRSHAAVFGSPRRHVDTLLFLSQGATFHRASSSSVRHQVYSLGWVIERSKGAILMGP